MGIIAPASATIVDVEYTGAMKDGTDGIGIFGAAMTDLTGAAFVLDFVFDTTRGQTVSSPTRNSAKGGPAYSLADPSPALQWTVTINGVKSTVMGGAEGGDIQGANGSPSEVNEQFHDARENSGTYAFASMYNALSQISGDIPATIDVPFTLSLGASDAASGTFSIVLGSSQTWGDFAPTVLTYSISTAGGAPEPSTWALLLVGFAGLGNAGYRMRRSMAAAAV
jgi:hypothetical protein